MSDASSTARGRSFFVTLFGVIGPLWFALHAVEYVFARYDALEAMLPLPEPLGLSALFAALPQWAGIALTVTIWLGLLGAFLLLLGDRASVLVLSFGLLAALATLAWGGMAFLNGQTRLGEVDPLLFAGGQAALMAGLWLYARTAKRYGTL